MDVDLVLLAMGFRRAPSAPAMLTDLGVKLAERGNVARDARWMTSVPGVFACGDMQARPVAHRVGDRGRDARPRAASTLYLMGRY
jgi:pyruvate/2-oxoglutarate dehydrogenase complex dihydrolipoamide dehydrogenase (E3) component